jgi:hypothetical protein
VGNIKVRRDVFTGLRVGLMSMVRSIEVRRSKGVRMEITAVGFSIADLQSIPIRLGHTLWTSIEDPEAEKRGS